eukprot:symbB.v1.2.006515.t1/scaffold380.1/size216529/5
MGVGTRTRVCHNVSVAAATVSQLQWLQHSGRTEESCCHKTCAAHQCSKGLVSVPSRAETFPSDDATCCEVAGCEKIRKLTKLQSGESCNTLSKDKCDSYFGSFINEKKRAILARCDFDRHFDLCRLSPSELDCVDL